MKEQDDRRPLSGILHMEDAYWGGERRGGKRARGTSGKTPIVAKVQTNQEGHPNGMRLTKLKSISQERIAQWAVRHLVATSLVVSDGLPCFSGVEAAGCEHEAIVTGVDQTVSHWKRSSGSNHER